jgi:hypothetical protein
LHLSQFFVVVLARKPVPQDVLQSVPNLKVVPVHIMHLPEDNIKFLSQTDKQRLYVLSGYFELVVVEQSVIHLLFSGFK